ncbi:probable glutathione S-transferase 9 isoform X2 [Porites lutea]|uniref:probable glutathione S-transferase 9 isoform X2 n=1 Tax=Porites lutea TaxID=51062 RepID=UPI003CC52F7F
MSGYKLFYFPVRGAGEKCRLAFAAAKIDYEDIRLPAEEWLQEKASGRPPLGQMPFIVTPEGKILAQSGTIMKYICKKGGLCPANSFDEATADMISDGVVDLVQQLIKIYYEKDETKKLSYADITFFDFFNSFHSKGKEDVPGELEKFPLLVEHYKRVLNVPEINEWVKKRPVTEF